MKTKDCYTLRTICGQNVLNAEGKAAIDMSTIISLNESAAYLWKNVKGKDFTEEDLKNLLLEEYEVDEETAAKDVATLVATWQKLGLLEG